MFELGCGGERDSAVLTAAGNRVIGVDRSAAAIAKAQARVPEGEFHCQDIRAPFPVPADGVGVIVASLSLHYFAWEETVDLVERVRRTLGQAGLLLCRLNSVNDHHFGANGHPQIDENFYLVDGEPKRFFDRPAVERLFAIGWRPLGVEEKVINRYERPKSVWEMALEKS